MYTINNILFIDYVFNSISRVYSEHRTKVSLDKLYIRLVAGENMTISDIKKSFPGLDDFKYYRFMYKLKTFKDVKSTKDGAHTRIYI